MFEKYEGKHLANSLHHAQVVRVGLTMTERERMGFTMAPRTYELEDILREYREGKYDN